MGALSELSSMSDGERPPLRDDEDTARGRSQVAKFATFEALPSETTGVWSSVTRTEPVPNVVHGSGTRVVKGEDVMYVHPLDIDAQPPCYMYMICDGHSGIEAASFVSAHFLQLLNPKMPKKLPDFTQFKDIEVFAEEVRKALCQTFFHLDNEWSLGGLHSGCTCTVALVTGWLISVANVGDSSAVLDTGASILELTKSHRLHDSKEEQARLRHASIELAALGFHLQGPAKAGEIGVGPLRLWPGGLCVARSMGDLDAGPEVLPLPNIRQVIIPVNGCRLVMASDGLWDVVTLSKACLAVRAKTTDDAAACLINAVLRDLRVMDDTSVFVVDALPADVAGWPSVVLRGDGGMPKPTGGLFACFKPEMPEPDSRDVTGSGRLDYFADVDTLKVYPTLKGMLNRTMMHANYQLSQHGGATGASSFIKPPLVRDFTQHGAHAWRQPGPGELSNHSLSNHSLSNPNFSQHGMSSTPLSRDPTISLGHLMSFSESSEDNAVEEGGAAGGGRLVTSNSAPTGAAAGRSYVLNTRDGGGASSHLAVDPATLAAAQQLSPRSASRVRGGRYTDGHLASPALFGTEPIHDAIPTLIIPEPSVVCGGSREVSFVRDGDSIVSPTPIQVTMLPNSIASAQRTPCTPQSCSSVSMIALHLESV